MRPTFPGANEPAKQSGLDVAANPKLEPRARARRADCYFLRCPLRSRGKELDHEDYVSLLRRAGCAQGDRAVLCAPGRIRWQLAGSGETFGTMTDDLLEMVESLKAQGVTHVAMESTGVFWKP